MKSNPKLLILLGFFAVFTGFFIYNYIRGTIEYADAVFSMVIILLLFLLSDWLSMGVRELSLAGLVLVFHNIGATWLYSQNIFFIRYDKIMHFFASFVGVLLVMGFFEKTLHMKKSEKRLILFLLSIGIILALGVFVEFIEFFGYVLGINSQGIFSPGNMAIGDTNYIDTITDLLSNFIGGMIGGFIYHFFKKKLK